MAPANIRAITAMGIPNNSTGRLVVWVLLLVIMGDAGTVGSVFVYSKGAGGSGKDIVDNVSGSVTELCLMSAYHKRTSIVNVC